MNEILLPMQKHNSSQYYAGDRQQYQNLKNNFLLMLAILGICFIIRLNEANRLSNVDESTKQLFFDVPLHKSGVSLSFSHIA